MAVPRQRADRVEHVLRHVLPGLPLGQDFVDLRLRRHVAGQQEVPERLDGRILRAGRLRQGLEGLGNRLAAEPDAFLRVEIGDVGDEAADVTGAADGLVDRDLIDDDLAKLLGEPVVRGRNSSIFCFRVCLRDMRISPCGSQE